MLNSRVGERLVLLEKGAGGSFISKGRLVLLEKGTGGSFISKGRLVLSKMRKVGAASQQSR